MRKYKTTGNTTLFDKDEKERKLTEMGDPLERLSKAVDFGMFRSELEDALLPKERKSNAGAKRYDVVMMFKLMVLQRYYNLSDEQAEFQIVDRTSFRRFLGLAEGDRIPDARTIWLFRERLVKSGKVGDLFQKFVDYLNGKGLIFNEGRMVDASFVSVPKQRNTPDENKCIKAVEDAVPRGAHLRLHGEHDAQAVHQDGGLGAGDGGDWADQPDLQHVALRANRQAEPLEKVTNKNNTTI
jgi:hypothetical protein